MHRLMSNAAVGWHLPTALLDHVSTETADQEAGQLLGLGHVLLNFIWRHWDLPESVAEPWKRSCPGQSVS